VWAEKFGLGELELLPWDFWRLTPREFRMTYEGFYRRDNRLWLKVARLGVAIQMGYVKETARHNVTVDRFVGHVLGRLWPRGADE
jgi:Phage tail assembly chaperone protein, TAC